MHEASLARNLLDQVISIQREHPWSLLAQVEIEVGPMSGVEPLLLRLAFDRLVAQTKIGDVELVLNIIPLQISCYMCSRASEFDCIEFKCSHCGSVDIEIVGGDCVRLLSVGLKSLEPHRGGDRCGQTINES